MSGVSVHGLAMERSQGYQRVRYGQRRSSGRTTATWLLWSFWAGGTRRLIMGLLETLHEERKARLYRIKQAAVPEPEPPPAPPPPPVVIPEEEEPEKVFIN